LGRHLAAIAYALRLSPNSVTLISATFTYSAIGLVAVVRPHWWTGFLVAGLLLFGYALDSADGQLARLMKAGSPAGEWLDHMVDALKVCLLHASVLISLYRFGDVAEATLLVPLGYQSVSSVLFFGFILVEKLRQHAATRAPDSAAGSGTLQSIVAFPSDYATLCGCFVLLSWTTTFVWTYTVLFVVNALLLAAVSLRWWRQLRAIGGGD